MNPWMKLISGVLAFVYTLTGAWLENTEIVNDTSGTLGYLVTIGDAHIDITKIEDGGVSEEYQHKIEELVSEFPSVDFIQIFE